MKERCAHPHPPPPKPPGPPPPRDSQGGVSSRGCGEDDWGIRGGGVFTLKSVGLFDFLDAREQLKGRVRIGDSLG